MKTLIFYLVLVMSAGIAGAQEITELKETKVGFAPISSEVIRSGDNFTFKVNESYVGEFEKDPLSFLNKTLNMKNFIAEVRGDRVQSYNVTLTSSRGSLEADYNSRGELVRSESRFKNIVLPRELSHQLYKDHKGWAMVKNVHITRGSQGAINKNLYKIKLENGKQRKNVTLEAPMENVEVAGN